jgi:CubicO group peptidase (beta-lactamase class C family)
MRSLFLAALAFGVAGGTASAKATTLPAAALEDVRRTVAAAPDETGLVVAVTDRDRLLMIATHGYADIERRQPVTADTRFAIGSISKSFAAITLMQLADEGRFDPAAPIARYLPAFKPRTRFAPITGHALMSHTSGLPNYLADVASMRFLIAALNKFEPRYTPGAHFWYSNSGYQLLGYAVEAIEHRPFPLVLQHRIFDRLGMTASAPQIDDRLRDMMPPSYTRLPDGRYARAPWFDYLAADGAIVSTASDMAAYARMLLARGAVPGGQLISGTAFDRITTPVLDENGYGFAILDDGKAIGHSGSIAGFSAYLKADLANGIGIVLLANGPLDSQLRERIIARLAGLAEPAASPPPAFGPASDFAGRFRGAGGQSLVFAAGNGGLMLNEAGISQPLTRLGRDRWSLYLTPAGPRSFAFFRDKAGVITDLVEGATGYARDGSGLVSIAAPAAYDRLAGRYLAHGEEGPGVRIFARNGQLMLAYADSNAPPTALVEDGPGHFRFADPPFAPEWLAFDTVIDGQSQRLILSGIPLYRVDLP